MNTQDPAGLYDAYYFATGCGRPYQRDDVWLQFFGSIADRILRDIGPATILDAGCALGFLVESLRRRGAEAYGIDISPFAIASVHPDIRPFCKVGSIAEPFPRKYDLIISIEVLEHLPTRTAEEAIANFCRHTDDVLFSSSPFDYKEATHFNVHPPEYWAEQFARHGFYHDVEFDASFITSWAMRFSRARQPLPRVITSYERRLWQLEQENRGCRQLALEQRNELAEKERARLELQAQTEEERQALRELRTHWHELQSSISWAVIQRLHSGRLLLAPAGSRRERWLRGLFRGLRLWTHRGTKELALRLMEKTCQRARTRCPVEPAGPSNCEVNHVDPVSRSGVVEAAAPARVAVQQPPQPDEGRR